VVRPFDTGIDSTVVPVVADQEEKGSVVAEPESSGALAGKVAAVTGATSGSGRAVARRFVAEGAHVVLLARGKGRLLAEAELLGERAIPIVTDVSDPDNVRTTFDEIAERFGRLDVLVNNAAVYRPCLAADLSDYDIERQVATNFLGPIYTCRAAISLLRAAGGGDIVNTSSESTLDPMPMLAMYVATKSALEAFSRTLMVELVDDNIRTTLIIQGTAIDGEGSTDWAWEPERTEQAFRLWAERGYLAKTAGHGAGLTNQSVDDVADVHVYAVTRPRGQRLDTIHVRSH
jgi:NAD(P)-dependent dehydrogenase (short-subunit alcohol dehydrogenase family)